MTCNSLLHLLSHPAQLGLVSADPGLLPDAVAESRPRGWAPLVHSAGVIGCVTGTSWGNRVRSRPKTYEADND